MTKLIGPALMAADSRRLAIWAVWCPAAGASCRCMYAGLLVVMAGVLWFAGPAPDRRPGSGRSAAAMLAPLKEVRIWRFGLYYVVVFGAYVALSLWLPNYYGRSSTCSWARRRC